MTKAMLRSVGTALGGATMVVALGGALHGCSARTEIADLRDGGGGADDGASSGGGPSAGTGPTAGAGGSSATSGESGGAGGTGGTAGGAGTNAECWDPTVPNYCEDFECPPQGVEYGVPGAITFLEETGICDDFTVFIETDDRCGAEVIRYGDGVSSGSFMYITGTLGAVSITREEPFGPCNQTHYYGGIEVEDFYASAGCSVISRCIACGAVPSDGPEYPPCRPECDCVNVQPGANACADPDSCECYCEKSKPPTD
jgi:hypothetical protein